MKFRISDLNADTIKKGFAHIRSNTIPEALSKARSMVTGLDLAYDRFFRDTLEADEEELAGQRQQTFAYQPCISILVPVYMTPELSLRAMLESVLHQTYGNWELCLVDGSQAKGEMPVLDARVSENGELSVMDKVYSLETERIIRQYMETEPRIRYIKMEENMGISGNSNRALAEAIGEYVALLDHDDVLTEDALYRVVSTLQEQQYDVLYSDEDRMSENGAHYYEPRFKPEFDIDLLREYNYISHLFVAKRSLMQMDGGFHSALDGAQGYDMILRCCEGNRSICHIPYVLYHKRIHDGTSEEREIKHAQENQAGKEALEAHIEREHLFARVMLTEQRSVYEVKYDTLGNPLVSIVVTGHTDRMLMERILEPFYEKSRYSNFEIIIVDQDSEDTELQKYYQEMQSRRRNISVVTAPAGKSPTEYRNLGSIRANGAYVLFLDANLEIGDSTALGEMLGIAMREDVGVVTGTLYDDRERLYAAGLEFSGAYETMVQRWQAQTERMVDLTTERQLYRYPYRGLTDFETWKDMRRVQRDETGAMRYYGMNREYEIVPVYCMLVKKQVFMRLGGFSDKFRTELSVLDFCLRVREHGYRIVNAAHAKWQFHDLPDAVRMKCEAANIDAQVDFAERALFEILWSHVLSLR